MASEVDFNDVLDDIFLREETQHKQSYEEGFKAGSAAGNPEGFHLGYHRGAELGRELGFYYGTVSHYLQTNENSDSKYKEKVITQLTKVKDLIELFPRENTDDQDILGMAENIRAQYRKACALLKITSTNPYDAGMRFSKMETILTIRKHLDSILRYLTPLLPMANCHMVEFITDNHWDRYLPKTFTEYLECLDLNEATEMFWRSAKGVWKDPTELDKWVQSSRTHYLTANNKYCLSREQFEDRIRAWGGEVKPEVKVTEFMNSKKSYEVQTMCGLVASVHELCNSSCCLEAGGGRGPLLTALSLSYNIPSLTVDCDGHAVKAAEDRAGKMKKLWNAIAKRVDGTSQVVDKNNNLHRFATAFITKDTDLSSFVKKCFPEFTGDVTLLLTGLHTCGNLGPDSLRIFSSQESTAALFNVPCCYHLLSEDPRENCHVFQRNSGDQGQAIVGDVGFPMSDYLKGTRLGRNARMLAAHSIHRVLHLQQIPARSLLHRAMLQVLAKNHLPNKTISEGKLKRLSKCQNFQQYFKMADSILALDLFDKLSNDYLEEFVKEMDVYWKKLVLFYLLRLCLAQVIEAVILLDRLLYLYEKGFEKVYLVKLFDPVLSPRCHSIVALR